MSQLAGFLQALLAAAAMCCEVRGGSVAAFWSLGVVQMPQIYRSRG